MTEIKVGQKLRSTVCSTEIVIVRPPNGPADITCGGHAMVLAGPDAPDPTGAPEADAAGGTLLGKRYADEELALEVLCTKPGDGSLGVNGRALPEKSAKPLPSSD
jgi:hypothetical protein